VTWRWKPGDAISRRLFEALRLEIRYDHTAYMATCEITLTGETIGTVARTSQERRQRQPAGGPRGARHADPRTTMRSGPQEPRPPPELHPRRLHGLRHLDDPASPGLKLPGDARHCRIERAR
jgi:hypothetical protein